MARSFASRTFAELITYTVPVPESGCWVWADRSIDGGGYGQIWHEGHRWDAHRLAYILAIGPISDDLDIDHLCRVRCCIRPTHLEPVTRAINVQRGISPQLSRERRLAITHCPAGHAYSPQNTRIHAAGYRYCLICHREQSARGMRALRSAA